MELFYCLWILITVCIQGCIEAAQQFEIKPSNVEVNPGEMSLLTCKVRERKGECAWLKDGKVMGRIDGKYVFLREPVDDDCSIRIYNSNIDGDDGMWQCQVTQTSLTEKTLTSPDVKFTVREPPLPPRIEDNTNVLSERESYPAQADVSKRLHCISRKGNPPALLKWFIEDQDITTMSNQTNSTDVDKEKLWQAASVLDYVFQKDHNGKYLRCVAMHAAYEDHFKEIRLKLDVLYVPEIRLEGRPSHDIEEGETISVKCVADANPVARIIWRRAGFSSIFSLNDQIDFLPVKKSDKGVYSCSATNDVGQSQELHVDIDVKYKPEIQKVSPNPGTKINIYNNVTLVCEADGNPPPKYSWLQHMGGDPVAWQQRGTEARLFIANVSYQYQGFYVCEATNVINGQQYKATSMQIHLDVTGAPQVLTDTSRTKRRVVVEKDEDAIIVVYFCSDPVPIHSFWEFGPIKLESGENHVRYIAEDLKNDDGAKDCYEARLIVRTVDGTDSRKYTLHVQNERGQETFAVTLEVREPVAVSVVIGIVVGCIVLLMIITLIVLYLLKAERMCFNRKSFKTDSNTSSDDESGRSAELLHNGKQNKRGAIPPDALYTASSKKEVATIDRPLYQNLKPDQNENQDGLVYASLDLSNSQHGVKNSKPSSEFNRQQHSIARDCTEYAEIQFRPREQADI